MLRDDAAPQRRAQEEGARAWSSSKGDVERLGRRLATLRAGPKGGLELSSRQKAAIFRASADLPPAETTSQLNARRDEQRAIRQMEQSTSNEKARERRTRKIANQRGGGRHGRHGRHGRQEQVLVKGRDGLLLSSDVLSHVGKGLRDRLLDMSEDATRHYEVIGQRQFESMCQSIKGLLSLAHSRYVETQRDAAAALHSLALNAANRVAFVLTGALPTLIELLEAHDVNIKRDATGTIYHLTKANEVKQAFMESEDADGDRLGLHNLMVLTRSRDRDTGKFAVGAIRELCESVSNRPSMLDQGVMPLLFAQITSVPNIAVRRDALHVLRSLADCDENRLKLLEGGCLPRLLALVNNLSICKDTQMRRLAAETLTSITALQPSLDDDRHHPSRQRMISEDVLKHFVAVLQQDDEELIIFTLRSLQQLSHRDSVKDMIVQADGLAVMFDATLVYIRGERVNAVLVQEMMRTVAHICKSPHSLHQIFVCRHVKTVLYLCRFNDKKVRRGAANLLKRISTLPDSKVLLIAVGALPLLLSMTKVSDIHIRLAAGRALAELAEEPIVRVKLVEQGVLPGLLRLYAEGDVDVHMATIQALADLAESPDNRAAICYTALGEIAETIRDCGDQPTLGTLLSSAVHALCNLCCPAGFVSTASGPEIGKHGQRNVGTLADLEKEVASGAQSTVERKTKLPHQAKGLLKGAGSPTPRTPRTPRLSRALHELVNFDLNNDGKLSAEEEAERDRAEAEQPGYWGSKAGRQYAAAYNTGTLLRIHVRIADFEDGERGIRKGELIGPLMSFANRTDHELKQVSEMALQFLTGTPAGATVA